MLMYIWALIKILKKIKMLQKSQINANFHFISDNYELLSLFWLICV